jgi:3,4-dihydroxy 2-butanone 4-phosphate synthase/GTP cyclohydrolase II
MKTVEQNLLRSLEALRSGEMIIVTDHHTREDEGDFIMASQFATPAKINFMAKWGRGLICAPITKEYAEKLKLPMMVESNQSDHETAFTVSIDAKNNISTGISAHDRAYTLKLMSFEKSTAEDFVKPGHIFPLVSKDGGLKTRQGHTEATIDLLELADLKPVGIICEIMNDDGTMARGEDLKEMARKFNMPLISIDDIREYQHLVDSRVVGLKEA